MLRRSWLVVVLVLGGFVLPAHAQTQLEWKFKKGDEFWLESSSSFKQTLKTLGKEVKQELEQTTVLGYKVQEVSSDKIVLDQKIVAMSVKNAAGTVMSDEKM